MNRPFNLLLLLFLLPMMMVAEDSKEILVCGAEEVYILDLKDIHAPRKIFSWKAQDRPEIPASFHEKFRTTDECKAVSGERILITSSSDGVALVDRKTSKTLFWGECANAHSAAFLPGERIAVACSIRKKGGNRLALFDVKVPEKEIFYTELYSGHGAVWDGQRGLLWALGLDELRAYSLQNWATTTPSLKLEATYPLPGHGGHELSAIRKSSLMIVSAEPGVWLFDRDQKTFTPYDLLKDQKHVKSANIHPDTEQLIYTQADSPDWWTSTIRFKNPDQVLVREGEKLYKVRWVVQ